VKQSQILIRYGEIGLKAENTRRQFTYQLKKNIKQACLQEHIPVIIVIKRGRLFLQTEEVEKSIHVLKKIFGVVSFSPVWESSSDLSVLAADVLTIIKNWLTSTTSFALRVRRSGIHEYTSQDVAKEIGQVICDQFNSPVDLDNPDVELFIEIRDKQAFLFIEKIDGIGGLPYGTQGKVCCVVKNSFDLLASWYLMKRGCRIYFVIFNKRLITKVKKFLKNWYIKEDIKVIHHDTAETWKMSVKHEIEQSNLQAVCTGILCHNNENNMFATIKELQQIFSLPVLTPLISLKEKECRKNAKLVGISL